MHASQICIGLAEEGRPVRADDTFRIV